MQNYFSHITTLHRTMPNFKCVYPCIVIFHVLPTLHRAAPNLIVHTHMFRTSQLLLRSTKFQYAQPHTLIFLTSQAFHHALIPREFHCKNWASPKKIPNFHHGHSSAMKLVQFHSDNANSTFAATNRCRLTFLECFFFQPQFMN